MRALAGSLRPPDWETLPAEVRPRVRALAWLAITAQVVFVLGWIAGWLLESGYSPTRDYISELGRDGGAHPWIFQAAAVIWGAGFIALAVGLALALRGRRGRHIAPALFGLAGVLAMLLAPFRLQCATTISRTCRALEEAGALPWHEYAHIWTAFALEIALWLTPFALARALWPGRLARLLVLGGVAVGAVIAVVYATGVGEGPCAGLVQRLELLIVHGWVIACAAALISESRRRSPAAYATPASLSGTTA